MSREQRKSEEERDRNGAHYIPKRQWAEDNFNLRSQQEALNGSATMAQPMNKTRGMLEITVWRGF